MPVVTELQCLCSKLSEKKRNKPFQHYPGWPPKYFWQVATSASECLPPMTSVASSDTVLDVCTKY